MLRNIRYPIFFSAEAEARYPPIQRKGKVSANQRRSSASSRSVRTRKAFPHQNLGTSCRATKRTGQKIPPKALRGKIVALLLSVRLIGILGDEGRSWLQYSG
jgi:hypothetical protein